MTPSWQDGYDHGREATQDERHGFQPYHPDWAKPRCKVCREFEDHPLHQAKEGPT
jgi:hypothetical protein